MSPSLMTHQQERLLDRARMQVDALGALLRDVAGLKCVGEKTFGAFLFESMFSGDDDRFLRRSLERQSMEDERWRSHA